MKADPRSDPRSHVFLMAVLCSGPVTYPVRVRNLSSKGALLEGASLPEELKTVTLKRGSLAVAGQVAWSKDGHCGLRFSGAINVPDWVDRAGPVGQQRIDATLADFRNGTSSRSTGTASLSGGRSANALSDDLLGICERLAAHPDMSIPLAEELIRIEAIAHALAADSQISGKIA